MMKWSKRRSVAGLAGTILIVFMFFLSGQSVNAEGVNKEISQHKELQKLILSYDNEGHKVDPKTVEAKDYEGYIFKLKDTAPNSYQSGAVLKEAEPNVKMIDTNDLYTATDLQSIDYFIDEQYIEYIEPNYKVKAIGQVGQTENTPDPNDPLYTSKQWNLDMMNVKGAWKKDLYGAYYDKKGKDQPVKVAVIDSGLYGTGTSQVASPHEDINYGKVLSGVNHANSSAGTPDTNGHGTFVSGMIFAQMNNGKGITGIMPDVSIMPVKVFGTSDTTYDSTIVSAIYSAINAKVDVINMSLGGEGYSLSLKDACDDATKAGILVIASAGNDGTRVNNYPAAFDSVVGVSSLDANGEPSYFSQYGASVNVAAPGAAVTSTFIDGISSYKTGSGTSFSCPEVAALAAMARSVEPELDLDGFEALLKETCIDKGSPGFDDYYGWGLVDFGAMSEELLKHVNLPIYHVGFDVQDQSGKVIKDAAIIVRAAEDINWEENKEEGVEAGSLKKGQQVAPKESGIFDLHRGSYDYEIKKEGYYICKGNFATYAENQAVKATLEEVYSLDLNVVDSEEDCIDETDIEMVRLTDGIREVIKQGKDGKYKSNLPKGTYRYDAVAAGYEESAGLITIEEKAARETIRLYTRNEVSKVSFKTVDESTKEALQDVTISVTGESGKSVLAQDDETFILTKGQKYVFSATKVGYEDEIGKILVGKDPVQSHMVNMEAIKFTLNVGAIDENNERIETPVVTIKDSENAIIPSSKTDTSKFNISNGKYTYVVSKSGYGDVKGELTIKNASRDIKVILPPVKHKVSFAIKDKEEQTLEGVHISVYDHQNNLMKQNSDGSYKLAAGSYRYALSKRGYETTKAGFTVDGKVRTIKTVLDESSEGTPGSGYEGGSGTKEDPYLIADEEQLRILGKETELIYANNANAGTNKKIKVDGYYELAADIELTAPWVPIGNYESKDNYALFSGSFNGGGYTISNVETDGAKNYMGLFGAIGGATIENVSVDGVIKGSTNVGGIAGCVFSDNFQKTEIKNCENRSKVSGVNLVGGIIGDIPGSTGTKINVYISRCSNTGSIKAQSGTQYTASNFKAGGITGSAFATRIVSCFNSGTVDAGYQLAGIAGNTELNSYIDSCYNTGMVTQKVTTDNYIGQVGGIVGTTSGNLRNSYFLRDSAKAAFGISKDAVIKNVERKTNSEMINNQSFVNQLNMIDEVNRGEFVLTDEFPALSWQHDSKDALYAKEPIIKKQPAGRLEEPYAIDDPADPLTVEVNDVEDGGILTYQWYRNDVNSRSLSEKIIGASGAVDENGVVTYTPETKEVGTCYYYMVVTNTVSAPEGEATNRCYSDIAGVAVEKDVKASKPVIKQIGLDGTEDTVPLNTETKGFVDAEAPDGGDLSYQWYKSKFGDTKGSPIKGETAKHSVIDTSVEGTFYYYVKVKNTIESGVTGAVDSSTINSARIKLVVLHYTAADKTAATAVIEKIKAIGKVTLNSKSKIADARTHYNKLTSLQKTLVSDATYKQLVSAEAQYQKLKKVYDDTKAFQKKSTKIKRVKAGKKKVTATWSKISNSSGYQLCYGTSKKLTKSKKVVTIKSGRVVKKTVVKLKSRKKYYMKVRAYGYVGGKKVYSKWSSIKSVKIK